MNKLYILGALALSGAHAYVNFLATKGAVLTAITGSPTTFNTEGLGGTYTYTYTGDCLASSSLASLGLNNNYYQYYSSALTAGTWAYAAAASPATQFTYITADPTASPAVIAVQGATSTITVAYSGCYHSHIYNWIAMPSMSATGAVTSASNGFGSAVCAYGYSMVGTATTDCAVSTIVTTDIFIATGTLFKGGQFQSTALSITPTAGGTATAVPVWGQHGPGYFATLAGTAIINSATQVGLSIISQNAYWDFMQSDVIQGLTTLGRGGGTLGTGPCGWYVGYFYEGPARGVYFAEDAFNKKDAAGGVTLNFWTDNSLLNAASAFVVAGLAGLLF